MPAKPLSREEAIRRCKAANPNLDFGMFHYTGHDCETIFKCTVCGERFRQDVEAIWRGYRPKCSCHARGER